MVTLDQVPRLKVTNVHVERALAKLVLSEKIGELEWEKPTTDNQGYIFTLSSELTLLCAKLDDESSKDSDTLSRPTQIQVCYKGWYQVKSWYKNTCQGYTLTYSSITKKELADIIRKSLTNNQSLAMTRGGINLCNLYDSNDETLKHFPSCML